MNNKRGKLERLLTIRQLKEELDRCALQGLFASVAEVETSLKAQQDSLAEARQEMGGALTLGGREERLLAAAKREVAESNKGRLKLLLRVRRAALEPAMKQYLTSRREQEEVKQLVEDAKRIATTEEIRRLQATADDWFVSRLSVSRKRVSHRL